MEALVKYYEEQLRLSKHRQFGASSEKTEGSEQLGLFDEAENTADAKAPEEASTDLETITYSRRKPGKREDDLSDLPVETAEYELPESERICPECGGALHEMSKDERCEIGIVPAKFFVKRHIQHVYSCRSCEKHGITTPIVTAKAPGPVIKGSLASPSAVAHIMCQKYVQAVPLYRQEQEFLRQCVRLSRQTMANWLVRCAEDWLEPVYERMRLGLLQNQVLHADETTLQVLQEPGRKANTNSYMWLYRTSGDTAHPIALYEYQPTRSSSHPRRFLEGWGGYLHTDGYSGYHNLTGVTAVGCWAHVRRKFDETVKSLPPGSPETASAKTGLDYCNRLFAFEHEWLALSPGQRLEKRLEQSKPVAEAFLHG